VNSTPANALEGVIVLGAPRSGTTLLRRLLDAHASISCPAETNVFTACGRFLRQEYIAEGVPVGVLSGLALAGIDETESLSRLREFAFQFHRDICRRQGKTVWAAKTPDDAFYIDEIERLCGHHSRFICLLRHGLDVACSLADLCQANGIYLAEVHRYVCRYPAPLAAFTHLWVDVTRRILSFLHGHPNNAMMVRYEDLVERPQAVMEQVFHFVGVDPEGWDMHHAVSSKERIGLGDWKSYQRDRVDQSSVGRWRKLSTYTVGELARVANPVLAQCGYERLRESEPRDPQEALRRYEIGVLLQAAAATNT
jgi:hypothetical protein